MKKFIEYCKYSHRNFGFIFLLILSGVINKISIILNSKTLYKIAERILCKTPYILYTPFGNYLCTTLDCFFQIHSSYESIIGDTIRIICQNKNGYLINIGSNIGRWCIDIVKNYDFNAIVFEPSISTYRNLQVNILLSGVENKIKAYNIGLGDMKGDLQFVQNNSCDPMGHVYTQGEDVSDKYLSKVSIEKFDDLLGNIIGKDMISNTKLIIMDVEGFELNVLKGMQQSLKAFSDINIILEIWENHKDKDKTINFLKDLGYTVKQIDSSNYLFSK